MTMIVGMEPLALGIDLGTTTVKTTVLSDDASQVITETSASTCANRAVVNPGDHEQDALKILRTVKGLVDRIDASVVSRIERIAVCGQMHGCVLWNSYALSWTNLECCPADCVSPLITWMDQRCDAQFLSHLPKSCNGLYSGYGCATLFWLKSHQRIDNSWNCAGTIQDLLVSLLCSLTRPIMTQQNAASWGFYDIVGNDWQTELLESAGFPTNLLPSVVSSGTLAGSMPASLSGIEKGTAVLAALGDLQASVFSQSIGDNSALLCIGTSAQLCFPFRGESYFVREISSVDVFPYFDGLSLAVAASLNGGNVLEMFSRTLSAWFSQLNVDSDVDGIRTRIESLLSTPRDSDSGNQDLLTIKPTIYGERHAPNEHGFVSGITHDNVSDLGQIMEKIVDGIIGNLDQMLPRELLKDKKVNKIVLAGQAAKPWFERAARKLYADEFEVVVGKTEQNAAFGAALFARQQLIK